MNRFKNKVCLVTGAASGIGKAPLIVQVCKGHKKVVWRKNEAKQGVLASCA